MLVTLLLSPRPRHLVLQLSAFGGAVTYLVAAFLVVIFHDSHKPSSVHAVDECCCHSTACVPLQGQQRGTGPIPGTSKGRSSGIHLGVPLLRMP